jgi:hypothetical protein
MAFVLYFDVRKFYPVRYEWGRITHLAMVAGAAYLLFCLVDAGPYHIAWKFLLLLFFCVTLYVTGFFVPEELLAVRRLIHPASRSDPH